MWSDPTSREAVSVLSPAQHDISADYAHRSCITYDNSRQVLSSVSAVDRDLSDVCVGLFLWTQVCRPEHRCFVVVWLVCLFVLRIPLCLSCLSVLLVDVLSACLVYPSVDLRSACFVFLFVLWPPVCPLTPVCLSCLSVRCPPVCLSCLSAYPLTFCQPISPVCCPLPSCLPVLSVYLSVDILSVCITCLSVARLIDLSFLFVGCSGFPRRATRSWLGLSSRHPH